MALLEVITSAPKPIKFLLEDMNEHIEDRFGIENILRIKDNEDCITSLEGQLANIQ